tara:strand:- start:226 stop:498 length:273 start_codon:yes stop_codon:yes gene_type:complete
MRGENKMETTDYNGWTNRNTWLVNLHFGGILQDCANDDGEISTDLIQEIFLDHLDLETKHLDATVMDFLDIEGINWDELAEWYKECADHA